MKLIILLLAAVLVVAACQTNTGDNVQIANPASEYCVEQGGKLDIKDEAGGQVGYCTLKDNTVCEEWAYFRGECPVVCAGCPMYTPPGPDFCKDGTIVSGGKDECGCQMPPTCTTSGICTDEQKTNKACTKEYMPVCGDNERTYDNKCTACASGAVESWTVGMCKEAVFCTEDAKQCPDGSYVGRNSENNCEFFPCPDPNDKPIPVEPDGGIGTDPYVRFVSTDTEECKTVLFQCIEGSSAFNDETGCGCKANEPKKYVSTSADECSRIKYMCESNYVPFSDEEGCGCRFTFESGASQPDSEGKLAATQCLPEQRNAEICTMEYRPVCGWNNENIQCFAYPCADTYSNPCQACANENVAYWTEGTCPSAQDDVKY